MKLKNVHYEYRGNDIWRIYFKDALEADDFRNERTDGKKPRCIVSDYFGIRWCVEAELEGRFNILRHYAKDPTNDYFSNDIWRALVKKIEGSDSDYIFDEIDMWYNATTDKCIFKIRCMNGTWTDRLVKIMLNSQFGMVTHENGYYDTNTVGEGGLCIRRSCCGIWFDSIQLQPYAYKTDMERIMFSVKDYCPNGKANIIKVSSWTNTFIGTNKENEKEYSWVDFKHYMGLLHANGSDIWDIEWKFDAACPMTGTEVADELHVYLKPEAYKRLFEKEKKVWISTGTPWSNGDYLARVQALTPPPVPKWVKLDGSCEYCKRDVDICKELLDVEPIIFINHKARTLTEFIKDTKKKEATKREEKNMGPKDITFAEYCRRLYWGTITPVKPTKILVQGTATIIWWSDGTKTIVKCQKGDKMDPEKGIAMCVMKKFMGTNETHSNYLDFAKDAILEYEKQQATDKAKKKAEADKKHREAAKKKGVDGNANYKRGTKAKTEPKGAEPKGAEPESKEEF